VSYVAVIFTSQLASTDGYDLAADRMEELAAAQPGYRGIESARDASGFGITVSYWDSGEAAAAWKQVAEHRAAQARGRAEWYAGYTVRIATVTREYGSAAPPG
jgi:heme-degrading monooxygenase HmoA